MVAFEGKVAIGGELQLKVIKRYERAPLSWRIRNSLRPNYIKGWLAVKAIAPIANKFGVTTITSELEIKVIKADGRVIDYGVVGRRVVTDAGVAFLVDDWDNNGQDQTTMNFHGIGTGTNAEAVGDTALQTESTTALNPDNTRATGTRSQPAANQYRTVGTLTADAAIVNTEHGIFSASATGTGTLWDRTVYSAINLANLDSLQATYTATITSGG